ncbi:MAG: rhomboid family intramembrane serine protease [Flavobacteriales bacterium]|nr:rhomboid family intramembrane serine protease [Flavobacteriales bacterium]
MRYGTGPLANTPTVVKNLVIINALMLLIKVMGDGQLLGYDLDEVLGMHYIGSPEFKPWQLVTYMFMHGNFWHLLSNMFGLFFLGSMLEYRWGSKRFLTYYMICGVGAAVLNMGVQAWEYSQIAAYLDPKDIAQFKLRGFEWINENFTTIEEVDPGWIKLAQLFYTPMVGASGAVFGILIAFGMLYPNTELMIFPLPIPIKAKYFVLLYGGYELYAGYASYAGLPGGGGNVAHFAHIGGLVVGFITVMIWKRRLPHT